METSDKNSSVSRIPPSTFYSRPPKKQTECDITLPVSDNSDQDIRYDGDSDNPSKNKEINYSSDEIEVEERGLLVRGSSHDARS